MFLLLIMVVFRVSVYGGAAGRNAGQQQVASLGNLPKRRRFDNT
jgi:hypothetical protein